MQTSLAFCVESSNGVIALIFGLHSFCNLKVEFVFRPAVTKIVVFSVRYPVASADKSYDPGFNLNQVSPGQVIVLVSLYSPSPLTIRTDGFTP